MSGIRGILAGALALVTLHTLVAYKGPSKRLADLAGPDGLAVRFVNRFLDPNRPAIPERTQGAAPAAARPQTATYPAPAPR